VCVVKGSSAVFAFEFEENVGTACVGEEEGREGGREERVRSRPGRGGRACPVGIVRDSGAFFFFEYEEDVCAACVSVKRRGGREGGGEIALSSKGGDRTGLRPSALLFHTSLTHASIL